MPTAADDQTDILAANERLTTELEAALRERTEARTQLTTVTTERDQARGEVTRLNGEVQRLTAANTEAQGQIATLTAERDRLAGVDHDFNRRLAAELAKHGIRASALPTGPQGTAANDLVAQYQAINDPKEKAEFIARHEKQLRAVLA